MEMLNFPTCGVRRSGTSQWCQHLTTHLCPTVRIPGKQHHGCVQFTYDQGLWTDFVPPRMSHTFPRLIENHALGKVLMGRSLLCELGANNPRLSTSYVVLQGPGLGMCVAMWCQNTLQDSSSSFWQLAVARHTKNDIDDGDAEGSQTQQDVPENEFPLARVKRKHGTKDKHSSDEDEEDAQLDRRALAQSNTVDDAMQMNARLWARSDKFWLPDS
eukprot:10276098-Karenia_brevis.AAC.1